MARIKLFPAVTEEAVQRDSIDPIAVVNACEGFRRPGCSQMLRFLTFDRYVVTTNAW